MRIGVLSDTHLCGPEEPLAATILEKLAGVDIILHAGDIVHPSVIDLLETIAPVHAVRGNMDLPALQDTLPVIRIVEAGPFRIGLIHGWGPPEGMEERIRGEFDGVHCIVYGHSHYPVCHMKDGILFFNPGSSTDRRWAPYCSIGFLDVSDTLEGRIVPV